MIISKSEAIRQGLEFLYSGRKCISGNSLPRPVKTNACPCDGCRARRSKTASEWKAKNKPLVNERARAANKTAGGRAKRAEIDARYRANNPEVVARRKRDWYEKSTPEILIRVKSSRSQRRESISAKARERYSSDRARQIERTKEWQRNNADKLRCYRANNKPAFAKRTARYRAAKLAATPAWADMDAIARMYAWAAELGELSTIPHEVDHIVPLRSRLVCGLHCEANLRVVPWSVNREKSNRHWPDMP